MQSTFKRLGPAALAFWSVCALAASAGAAELKPWRHGVLEAKSDSGFILMVDRGGFAEKHGLKLQTTQMKNGSTVMKALLAGELETVEMGAAEAIIAGARGADVKILGCTWPGLPQVVMAKADIKTPQELKGRTIAASSPGSLPDQLARALLDNYKIPASEVKFANLGADLDRYKAMLAGVADAAVVSNEFGAIAPAGFKVLVQGHAIVPNFIRLCVTTTGKVLSEHRADLVQFVAAEMEAYRYASTHRAEAVKLAHELTGAKADDPRAEFIFDQAIKEKQIDPAMEIPVEKIDWMQNLFVKTGVLQKTGETAKFVDQSVRKDALAIVGK
ncbi:MAG TPA: ABC transporter substrate-binding protein [Xanthobacteraceae bacterium]|nr:ABC transporter substrate-binding protein [Xanthobacteraceae bacterium]